eukprot:1157628-Pelagomonas_calceolata.AAC.11
MQVRTAVMISIPVINPLDVPLKLAVRYGHDALVGPNVLELPAKSTVRLANVTFLPPKRTFTMVCLPQRAEAEQQCGWMCLEQTQKINVMPTNALEPPPKTEFIVDML